MILCLSNDDAPLFGVTGGVCLAILSDNSRIAVPMADSNIVNLFGEDRAPVPAGGVDLAHSPQFSLGPLTVVPSRRVIEGGDDILTLEPKVMKVLVALGQSPGVIVSRDELIERCWDGRIVGDASINRVISLLRGALRDAGGDAVSIETVAKVGYRVLVSGEAVSPLLHEGAGDARPPVRTWSAGIAAMAAGALVLLIAAILAFTWSPKAPADGPVIVAMMPLEDESGGEPFFAKGLESELRGELARSPSLEVTMSETAAQLAADNTDPQKVGQLLGADFVLTGKLRREASRVVLAVRLADVETGRIAWSDELASASDDAASLPLRTARSMLREIGLPANATPDEAALDPRDFGLYLTAIGLIRSRDPQQLRAARDILSAVTQDHPDFAGGWSALAKAAFLSSRAGAPDTEGAVDIAREAAGRAYDIDPQSVEALKIMGLLAETERARFEFLQDAVERDPGDSEAWLWLSHVAATPEFASQEVHAMERLAAIDPLWGRSWQASYFVAQDRGTADGIVIDERIASAASQPFQADAARGRIAAMRGDLSEAHRLTLQAMTAMTAGQRQMAASQLGNLMLLMGIDLQQPQAPPPYNLVQQTMAGNLPQEKLLIEAGLDGQSFWQHTPLVISAPAQMLASGRGAELLRYYDAAFPSPKALNHYASGQIRSAHFVTNVATYVGFAMREAGREDEARRLFALAERTIARWRANETMSMTPLLFEANLAAAQGQEARALDALERAIALGYPYVLQSPGVVLTGPMLEDSLWNEMRGNPRLRDLLAPIRSNIEKERRQILSDAA